MRQSPRGQHAHPHHDRQRRTAAVPADRQPGEVPGRSRTTRTRRGAAADPHARRTARDRAEHRRPRLPRVGAGRRGREAQHLRHLRLRRRLALGPPRTAPHPQRTHRRPARRGTPVRVLDRRGRRAAAPPRRAHEPQHPGERMTEPVIDVRGLTRRFGTRAALDGVSLAVPRGVVFGLVGPNGAGKTTLIKHLLGLLRPDAGTVRVFGIDPVADPPAVLGRVGYLDEDNDLPAWMRVGELIRYTRAFYPGWDDAYAERLRRTFDLDPSARVRRLSKGQRARAGLLVALAHRPELLLLDEPSSGLDPVVRRDILTAVIRTVADEGRTVLFSSHLLHEVERASVSGSM